MKKFFTMLATLGMLVSCSDNSPKMLILYYSQTGATAVVAEEIQKLTGADIERFDVVEAYNGTFDETITRCNLERESGFLPTLVPVKSNLSKYDVIFLGFPVWYGTYAPPVQALINTGALDGKTVVPFCTFGSGGLESSTASLKSALNSAGILDGFGIRNARIQYASEELDRFLIENGYKEGYVAALPDYSAQSEVSEEEVALFNEACSDYQFPLGTPVTVASRSVDGGTDYVFKAQSPGMDGQMTESTIYVVTREGRKAEFTKVVR